MMEEMETNTHILSSNGAEHLTDVHMENMNSLVTSNSRYKNGINGLELLMSMAGDMNKNLSTKNASGSVSYRDRSFDENSQIKPTIYNSTSDKHANQLLMAAASVVTNGYVGNGLRSHVQEKGDLRGTSPVNYSSSSTTLDQSYMDGLCTTVSFSSKTTMSTGFSPTSLIKSHMAGDNVTHTVRASMSAVLQPELNTHTNIIRHPAGSKFVAVPYLWKRLHVEDRILYESPTGEVLNSLEEVKSYLLSEDTCKCGLPCPFHIDKVFKFDPSVESQIWRLSDIKAQSLSSQTSCCHKKHIQSNALANDCMALIKSAKPIPARRKAKLPTHKISGSKSASNISRRTNPQSKKVSKMIEPGHLPTKLPSLNTLVRHTTPIPPIETVMRSPQTLYTPPQGAGTGLHSPHHMGEMVSPTMPMMPPHPSMSAGGHMVPVISHTGFSNPNVAQQLYRHPTDPGILSPGGPGVHPGFYSMMPCLPPPPPPHRPMPPYVHPTPYDYMHHQRPWNSPPALQPMPPPSGAQFGPPPIWHTRPDAVPPMNPASRKRRRRASSLSSNGNSDTGYTSGLSSPAHASPGQHKPQDKPENLASKSKHNLVDMQRPRPDGEIDCLSSLQNQAAALLEAAKRSGSSNQQRQPTGTQESQKRQHTSVIKQVPEAGGNLYAGSNGMPSYADSSQRIKSSEYSPSQQQPLPPIYLTERPAHYPSSHLDRPGGLKSSYSLSPHSRAESPATALPPPAHSATDLSNPEKSRQHSVESLSATGKDSATPEDGPSNHGDNKSQKSNTVYSDEVEPKNLTKMESGNFFPHEDMVGNSPFGPPPPMLMNGFQSHFSQQLPPGMHYPPGHPAGMPRDYGYAPRPPMQMMRAPNGQLFYRYAVPPPRLPMTPQSMPPYPLGPGSMYQQLPPFMGSHSPTQYDFLPTNIQSSTSPKRKRRKANAKTVIESHSAVLAGKSDNSREIPRASIQSSSAEPSDVKDTVDAD